MIGFVHSGLLYLEWCTCILERYRPSSKFMAKYFRGSGKAPSLQTIPFHQTEQPSLGIPSEFSTPIMVVSNFFTMITFDTSREGERHKLFTFHREPHERLLPLQVNYYFLLCLFEGNGLTVASVSLPVDILLHLTANSIQRLRSITSFGISISTPAPPEAPGTTYPLSAYYYQHVKRFALRIRTFFTWMPWAKLLQTCYLTSGIYQLVGRLYTHLNMDDLLIRFFAS